MRMLKFDKSIIFLILIILILAASVAFIYLQLRTDKVAASLEKGETISFLLVVGEEREIIFSEVVFFQNTTGKCALVDVPTNVGVIYEEQNKIGPVDIAFENGDESGYVQDVSELLDTEIDFLLYIEKEKLVELVDLLEGVDLFIANPVEFESEEGLVLLPSGSLTLDGAKASIFATYKEPQERENEVLTRKQKFVQSLFKKMGEMHSYLQNKEVRAALHDTIESDISNRAIDSLVASFQAMDYDQVVFQRILGNERIVDEQALLFPYYEGRLIKETIQQTLASLKNKEVVSTEELNVTLEILNGTQQNGLAGRTSQVYKSFGYDVAKVGNAESQDYEKTLVIGWHGAMSAAQQVANIIQCKNVEQQTKDEQEMADPIPGADVIDVTIILGKDFDGRYCKD